MRLAAIIGLTDIIGCLPCVLRQSSGTQACNRTSNRRIRSLADYHRTPIFCFGGRVKPRGHETEKAGAQSRVKVHLMRDNPPYLHCNMYLEPNHE